MASVSSTQLTPITLKIGDTELKSLTTQEAETAKLGHQILNIMVKDGKTKVNIPVNLTDSPYAVMY